VDTSVGVVEASVDLVESSVDIDEYLVEVAVVGSILDGTLTSVFTLFSFLQNAELSIHTHPSSRFSGNDWF
jgi:hypothetical protein